MSDSTEAGSETEEMEQARALRVTEAVRRGDVRIAARLMRDLDDRRRGGRRVLQELWPHTGRAFVLGITGNPGAGKSTVVDGLIAHYRGQGLRVGVVVIDPTSPFSGGAILGDRIRMQRHAVDDGVFIRSLATRGHLGGLSRSTGEVVAVLDAMGYEVIIVETVGVGQGEVDVVSQADTAVVVTVPGLGDEVQAIKAGILEIADVLVVNKADREGADRAERDLMMMLDLRTRSVGVGQPQVVPIVKTVAIRGEGVSELARAIAGHRERGVGEQGVRRTRRAAAEVRDALMERVEEAIERATGRGDGGRLIEEVAARRMDPYRAADRLLEDLLLR